MSNFKSLLLLDTHLIVQLARVLTILVQADSMHDTIFVGWNFVDTLELLSLETFKKGINAKSNSMIFIASVREIDDL